MLGNNHSLPVPDSFSSPVPDVHEIIEEMNLVHLNIVLYRSDTEEREDGFGGGVYSIPGYGDIVYCGLQGKVFPVQFLLYYMQKACLTLWNVC